MAIHLRQIALVAQSLAPAIDDLNSILGVNSCFVDEGVAKFGLENTLIAVGTDFIEVVAPTEEGTAGGRYLERRKGDGGYMVICQADSEATQLEVKERALAAKVRVAWEVERPEWHIMQLHPGDLRASFLEVDSDQHNDFTGVWHAAGGTGWEPQVDRSRTSHFHGLELQSNEPAALAEHWGSVLGTQPQTIDGEPQIQLANAALRFVQDTDGRGPGLGGVDIAVCDRPAMLAAARERNCYVSDDQLMICGVRFNLSDV